MITIKRVSRFIYFLITGILLIPLTLFFASGGIAENYYGGTQFSAPEFFWLIAIWGIGLLVHFKWLWAGVIITSLPVFYLYVTMYLVGYTNF